MPEGAAARGRQASARGDAGEEGRRRDAALHERDHRPRQHRRKRGAHPEPAARPARRQRGDRARGPGHRSSSGSSASIGRGPQIAAKCKQLVVAAGSFPAGPPEPSDQERRRRGAEAVRRVADADRGGRVGSRRRAAVSGASIEKDFAWSPAHPVVDAYRAFKPMPYDAPAPALAAVLYAVHPDDGYFKLSEPGTISVLDDGRTRFTPAGGRQAPVSDRGSGAEGAGHRRCTPPWCPPPPAPRPGRGRRRSGARNETCTPLPSAVAVRSP